MYIVKIPFTDRLDGNHEYKAGDTYPREGYAPTKKRLQALCEGGKTAENHTGKIYLMEVSGAKSEGDGE
jgi:hypothetical protein